MHVVVTAGHAGHGKSALIRALTGAETSRPAGESGRELTSEHGFGRLTLADGEQLTIIDVPGHQRSVGSLLAGAGAASGVLFVVAADEGWMPQSAEHLAVLSALGLTSGVLVVTKADIADPAPVLAAAAAATALGGLDVISALAVSSVTGAGMLELSGALNELVRGLPEADPGAPVRIWIDRAVGMATGGTAVSGTLSAGTVRRGDQLCVTPSMRPVRVTELRSHGESAVAAVGSTRVAVGLAGLGSQTPHRGMALVQPGRWTLTDLIDVRIKAVPVRGGAPIGAGEAVKTGDVPGRREWPSDEPAAGSAGDAPAGDGSAGDGSAGDGSAGDGSAGDGSAGDSPAGETSGGGQLARTVTAHIGPARVVARVRSLGVGLFRLSLSDPLPLQAGDRVVLRDASGRRPGAVSPVTGAVVLDVAPPALARRGAAAAAAKLLATWPDRPGARELLARHGIMRASELLAMGIEDHPVPVTGEWLADPERWRSLSHQLGEVLAHHAAADPLAGGLSIDAARTALDLPDRRLVLALARPPFRIACGALHIATAPGGAGAAHSLPEPVLAAVRVLRADLLTAPFASPDSERLRKLGLDARGIAAAVRAGELMRISEQIVLGPGADVAAATVLSRLEQPFTAAQARQALDTTRRTAIPLLEYLDSVGITERLPDDRRVLRRTTPRSAADAVLAVPAGVTTERAAEMPAAEVPATEVPAATS
jgi:selenocysteine-specific elongation factor